MFEKRPEGRKAEAESSAFMKGFLTLLSHMYGEEEHALLQSGANYFSTRCST